MPSSLAAPSCKCATRGGNEVRVVLQGKAALSLAEVTNQALTSFRSRQFKDMIQGLCQIAAHIGLGHTGDRALLQCFRQDRGNCIRCHEDDGQAGVAEMDVLKNAEEIGALRRQGCQDNVR